jgi:xylitol oxidase
VAPLTNWAGNLVYSTDRVHSPASVDEVQALVKQCRRLRPLGSRHSFNGIADTTGELISVERLDRVLEVDRVHGTVTVEGGVRYGQLCAPLERAGLALHNMASLPHISVAGACATATHGSGDRNGGLATAVSSMEVVTADGELAVFSGQQCEGAAVSLGGLGVVTKLTLRAVPAFDVRQDVYEGLPLDALQDHFEEIASSLAA